MAALVQDAGYRDGEFYDKVWGFFRAAAECQEHGTVTMAADSFTVSKGQAFRAQRS